MSVYLTGGFGFIGSNLIRRLNLIGIVPIVCSKFDNEGWKNVCGLQFSVKPVSILENNIFYDSDVLIHLAANTDTREGMSPELWENNVEWPVRIFKNFTKVIYASSASVYGAEENDFSERIYGLKPLNAYGFTKLMLDERIFGINNHIPANRKIYALRFFNVWGPNERIKGDMQSVISQVINKDKRIYSLDGIVSLSSTDVGHELSTVYSYKLFKSYRQDVMDGEQKRDFVHVDDVCNVILHFLRDKNTIPSDIYNLGSGVPRSYNDVIKAIVKAPIITYVEMPDNIKNQYQYYTCADISKLRHVAGYKNQFISLEEGVEQCKIQS